jgi:hypothetical protein
MSPFAYVVVDEKGKNEPFLISWRFVMFSQPII